MLLTLLIATALAGTDAPPRRAQRRIASLHAEARADLDRCAAARPESERDCLGELLARWESATVRARGRDWPVHAPGIDAARSRHTALVLDHARTQRLAEASLEWSTLRPRLDEPDTDALTLVDGFIARWSVAQVEHDGERVAVRPQELRLAESIRPQVEFGARVIALDAPPWTGRFARGEPTPPPVLRQRDAKKNAVIDDARWFHDVDWRLPAVFRSDVARGTDIPTTPPPAVADLPRALGGEPAHRYLVDGELRVGVFGAGSRWALLGLFERETSALVRAFDFTRWITAPATLPGDEGFVDQSVGWAEVRGGVLFVSHFHRTYARSSRGHNAYLSAIDVESGTLLWRSAPLVCNAANFVVTEDHILCGYGFTAEPDRVTVVDRRTGRTTGSHPVKTGPDWLLLRDGVLYVRTYDTDYTFDVR